MAKKTEVRTEPNLPAVVVQRMQVLSLMQDLSPEGGGKLVAGSFDPTDPSNLQMAIEADLPSDFDRGAMEGQVFEVRDWYARWCTSIAPEDKDPVPGIRVTLWNPDGKRFTFSGTIAVKCWERTVSLIGPGPYEPPLRVTVQSFLLPNKNVTYGVVPISGPKEAVRRDDLGTRKDVPPLDASIEPQA